MFKVGDNIIHGSSGACRVENIGTLNTGVKGRTYYTLVPYYVKGSSVYTPVDGNKVIMRPVMTKEEVMNLIEDIKNIDTLWVKDEKKREETYKSAIRSCDARELVKIIKTIYMRRKERIAEGKKMTYSDEKYFRLAEENLYGEVAVALSMTREEAKEFVERKVEEG